MQDSPDSSDFTRTRWTLISRAAASSASGQQSALQEVLRIYIPALRGWLQRRYRMDTHQADDLIQDFVVSRILQKNLLKAASEQRGRFRSLLLSSLERFVIDQHRRRNAAKRSQHQARSFDETSADVSSDSSDSFDADWAHSVLREAIQRMWDFGQNRDNAATWNVFVYRVLVPLVTGREPITYDRLVTICGFTGPRQASNALITAKRSFDRFLRSIIDEYTIQGSEIDQELAELKLVLLKRGTMTTDFLPDDVLHDPSFQAAIAGQDAAPDSEISRLFSIELLHGTHWGTADLGAMGSHFLDARLTDFIAVPPEMEDWHERTVRDLFVNPEPPRDLLHAVKNQGRHMVNHPDEPTPSEAGAFFYFMAIAVCLVRYNLRLSRSPSRVIRSAMEKLLRRQWLEPEMAAILSECVELLPDH